MKNYMKNIEICLNSEKLTFSKLYSKFTWSRDKNDHRLLCLTRRLRNSTTVDRPDILNGASINIERGNSNGWGWKNRIRFVHMYIVHTYSYFMWRHCWRNLCVTKGFERELWTIPICLYFLYNFEFWYCFSVPM